jgi:hypothetical protein
LVKEDGLRGMTSNPAIFEKTSSGSPDYQECLDAPESRKLDAKSLYERVALRAIQTAAACVLFLVNGGEKAEAVRHVLEGEASPERFRARLVCPTHGRLFWLVDKDAARLLSMQQSALRRQETRP